MSLINEMPSAFVGISADFRRMTPLRKLFCTRRLSMREEVSTDKCEPRDRRASSILTRSTNTGNGVWRQSVVLSSAKERGRSRAGIPYRGGRSNPTTPLGERPRSQSTIASAGGVFVKQAEQGYVTALGRSFISRNLQLPDLSRMQSMPTSRRYRNGFIQSCNCLSRVRLPLN
jgi:hypothetical protein